MIGYAVRAEFRAVCFGMVMPLLTESACRWGEIPKTSLSHRITKRYIPYEEKIAECSNIVEVTSYIDMNGQKLYNRNTPSRAMIFSLTLIKKYTDIEINFENVLPDYNLLEENDLIEPIINAIPAKEISIWQTVMKMIEDDKAENERSLLSKLDALSITANTFLEALEQALSPATSEEK